MTTPQTHSSADVVDGRKRVLIVDDAASVRDVLSVSLQRAGFAVSLAQDGVSALQLLRRCKVDIVVTDWEMPEMNGKELCRRIRELTPDWYVYTILMTAHSQRVNLVDALRAGADEYVTKPIIPSEIVARLDAAARLLDMLRHLRQQASHDSCTGVLNRKTILEILEREFARSERYSVPLSVLMIDIDSLSTVNDTHGRVAGDRVLRRIAQLARKTVRHCDYVGRYEDDKILVVVAEATAFEAAACAKRLREGIKALQVTDKDQIISLTASVGVAECSAATSDSDALLEQTMLALSKAKRGGRDRVQIWKPEKTGFAASSGV